MFEGRTIGIAGMGRSGIGAAKAIIRRGGKVVLYDEKQVVSTAQLEQIEQLQGLGAQVISGWHGRFENPEFDLLISSPGMRRDHPALLDAVRLQIPIWSEVELAYQISEAPILAITGTNGKTTSVVLSWLLAKSCTNALLCGNIAGSGYDELTLCEAADIAQPEDLLVAEVSSYQLEWIEEFVPKVAAITNITPDHLDRHPNFEDYRDTKFRIFENLDEGDCAVVIAAEGGFPPEEMLAAIPAGPEIRFAGEKSTGYPTESWIDGELVMLRGLETGPVEQRSLPIVGRHNFLNLVTAWEMVIAALEDRADPAKMFAALQQYKGVENRMEIILDQGGVRVINNSMCTNPAAVISSLSGISGKIHPIMGGVTKQLDFAPVKNFFEANGIQAYVFGSTEPGGLLEQLGETARPFSSLEEATVAALTDASSGESVILAPGCASAAPFANFMERGAEFKRIVRNRA